jgi:hypothetical protein
VKFALTSKKKASAILASPRPRGGWKRANPPKSMFRTLLKTVARPSPEARPETRKDPSCSEIEVIIRDFESGPGVFADDRDGAFAFGSRRDIQVELLVGAQARILYDHCRGVRWGMMPHTAA